jgi:nucleotide-binding universal stress UspA family protein
MLKILVPVDGSKYGEKAIAYVVKLHNQDAQIDVHLLNVQIPIDSGHARLFVEHDELLDYYRDEGLVALQSPRAALEAAGVTCGTHIAVGRVADTIMRYAEELCVDKIIMGTWAKRIIGGVAGFDF